MMQSSNFCKDSSLLTTKIWYSLKHASANNALKHALKGQFDSYSRQVFGQKSAGACELNPEQVATNLFR